MTSYSNDHNFSYSIDSKILFIDSNDRDITKWPNSSEFEINCPQVYNNVCSLNLLNIVLPNPIYNISDYLQNNKLVITISGIGEHIITLEDGYYDVETLRSSLQNKINRTTNENLVVAYNNVSRKYYFGHTNNHIHSGNGNNSEVTHNITNAGFFKLIFDKQLDFSSSCVTNVNVYSQHSNWGLGYILGFDKKTYSSRTINTSNNLTFDYSNVAWIDTSNASVISSPYPHTLDANENIYIELEKYNKCDELKPYLSYNYNNSNSGIVNSAFAKIPSSNLAAHNSNITVLLDNEISSTISYFKPPIEKIAKLKIKIRYHNNMLVNLQNANVSLSLSVNQEVKDFAPLLR